MSIRFTSLKRDGALRGVCPRRLLGASYSWELSVIAPSSFALGGAGLAGPVP